MREIVWVCDYCGEDVGSDGALMLRQSDVARWDDEYRAYRERTAGKTVLSVRDLQAHPRQSQWFVTHTACDPNLDDNRYWIGTGAVSTFRGLVEWTAHLLGKDWVAKETDWASVLGHVQRNGTNRGRLERSAA